MTQTTVIALDKIRALDQDRKSFDRKELEELAAHIDQHGLIQPIVVRPDGDEFVIVAGERRFRAHVLLERPTIEAIVRDLDERTTSAVQLGENNQRADLDAMEEATAYRARMDAFDMTTAEIASWSSKTEAYVKRRLSLLDLGGELQQMVKLGDLNVKHAEALAVLDINRQRLALKALTTGRGLSWWQFKNLCDKLLAEQSQETMFDPDSFLQIEEIQKNARKTMLRFADVTAVMEPAIPALRYVIASDDGELPPDDLAALQALLDLAIVAQETRGSKSKATKNSAGDKIARRQQKKGS